MAEAKQAEPEPVDEDEEEEDDFDPFLHASVPRNLYNKFQIEGSKRWGPPTEILPFLYLGSCFCANEEELLRELNITHILNVAEECPPPPTVARSLAKKEGDKLVKHYMMVDVVEHIRKSENQWNTFEACFNFIDKARIAHEGESKKKKKKRESKRETRSPSKEQSEGGERKGSGLKLRLGLRSGKDPKDNGPAEGGGTDRVLVHCMHGRSRSATIVLAYLMKKEGWTLREAYVHVKLRRPIVGPDKYLKHQLIEYEKHLFGKSTFSGVEEFREFQLQLSPESLMVQEPTLAVTPPLDQDQQELKVSTGSDPSPATEDLSSAKVFIGEEGTAPPSPTGSDTKEQFIEIKKKKKKKKKAKDTQSDDKPTSEEDKNSSEGKPKTKKKKKKRASSEDPSRRDTPGEEKQLAS